MLRALTLCLALSACLMPLSAYAGSPGNNWPDLSVPAPTQGGGEKDAALIIGISDYESLPDIRGAADNAREWQTYLTETRKLDPSKVFVAIDQDAYLETIQRKLEGAVKATQSGGTLWVIYIGHGFGGEDKESKKSSGLLVLRDAKADIENLTARSLSQDKLLKEVNQGKQGQTILLLDACFSGKTPDGQPLIDTGLMVSIAAPDADDIIKRSASTKNKKPKKTLWLTATDKDQFAGPIPGTRRPAFSYLMLGAMRGWADNGDGKITAQEAVDYAGGILLQAADRKQTPKIKGNLGEKFVLSQGKEEKPSPTFNPIVEVAEGTTPKVEIEMVTFSLSSNPTGAKVFVNNVSQAVTPVEMKFPKEDKSLLIRIEYDGYAPQESTLSASQDQKQDFVLLELPKPKPEVFVVDTPKQSNRTLYAGALGLGALGTGIYAVSQGQQFCQNGGLASSDLATLGALPAVSGLLGGGLWMLMSNRDNGLVVPSVGATGAALLITGAEFAAYRCQENRAASLRSVSTAGLGLIGLAAIDFTLWGLLRKKSSSKPKAALHVSPLPSGALLQLRSVW